MITPLFDNVIVEPKTTEEVRASGIVLPDTLSKDRPQEGTVLSVGSDCKAVKKGDVVFFKTYSPTEFKKDGKTYLVLKEEDVLGVLQK